jgi:cytosine/adenosine deaminase-related metal-dependent hydrolase
MENAWTLTARWLIPIDGPPLPRGTLTIEGERIVAIEPYGQRTASLDFGNVAVLPGFVNAHTHLDLSGMRGRCPPTADFIQWLRGVVRYRRSRVPDLPAWNVFDGAMQAARAGTTLLGDIVGADASNGYRPPECCRCVAFKELLGLPFERIQPAWEAGVRWVKLPTDGTSILRRALSPHAPYSVHQLLFRQVAARARQQCAGSREVNRPHLQLPVAIHLAETRDELDLIERRTGPFVEFLTALGVWHPDGLVQSVGQLVELFADAGPVLFIHCNYLDPATPMPPNATIVYCPRTHAAFGHPPHPFREFLRRGVRVALGTDSLASNPDLDILAEARFVHRHYPDVPAAKVLRTITLSGAEALGWETETGSLTPGKSADLVLLPLPDADRIDPCALVLQSAKSATAVLFRGQWTVGHP